MAMTTQHHIVMSQELNLFMDFDAQRKHNERQTDALYHEKRENEKTN